MYFKTLFYQAFHGIYHIEAAYALNCSFQVRSRQDFEVSGGATVRGVDYLYGVKHQRGDGHLESGFRFSSPKVNLDVVLKADDR